MAVLEKTSTCQHPFILNITALCDAQPVGQCETCDHRFTQNDDGDWVSPGQRPAATAGLHRQAGT